MSKERRLKPLPKRGDEGVQEQITPYYAEKAVNDGVFEKNRGNDLSQKGDNQTDFNVGLEDHDTAIKYYFENVIKSTVIQNGSKVKVPILYGNQELWKTIQADGFLRDKDAKIMSPLIMFTRDSFVKNRDLGNKLDANKAHLYQIFEKKYTSKNNYDRFSVLTNRIPEREFVLTVVPDYITITYSCIVFTEYVEQMNPIIEAINYASDSYWGDLKRFKFRTKIDGFSNLVQLNVGEDRIVKSTFNIILNGYIIPETINKEISTSKKFFSKSQIAFSMEVVSDDPNNTVFEKFQNASVPTIVPPSPVTIFDSFNISNRTTIINNNYGTLATDELAYTNVNITRVASIVNSDNATFTNTNILQPPTGSLLPATSLSNFSFYVNGNYVPSIAIISLTEVGNMVNVVFNIPVLDYTLLSTDEVVGIGKFKDA